MNYYGVASKILYNNQGELNNYIPYVDLESMKQKYSTKLEDIKTKLQKFNNQEDVLFLELNKYKNKDN